MGDNLHRIANVRNGDSRAHSRHHLWPAIGKPGPQPDRNPEIHVRVRKFKIRWHHACDCVGLVGEQDHTSDYIGIAPKYKSPKAITEYGYVRCARIIIRFDQGPAQAGPSAQHHEQTSGCAADDGLSRLVNAGYGDVVSY